MHGDLEAIQTRKGALRKRRYGSEGPFRTWRMSTVRIQCKQSGSPDGWEAGLCTTALGGFADAIVQDEGAVQYRYHLWICLLAGPVATTHQTSSTPSRRRVHYTVCFHGRTEVRCRGVWKGDASEQGAARKTIDKIWGTRGRAHSNQNNETTSTSHRSNSNHPIPSGVK